MTSICLSCTSSGENNGKWHDFEYSSKTKYDYKAKMFYTDAYFTNPASTYNPSLATASLSLAMAGFASNKEGAGSYNNRFQNAKSLLESLGFEDVVSNEDYTKAPETDSFGAVFGHKKLQDSTLIAVTTRGGGYLKEWASNFTIGTKSENEYSKGFYQASDIYLNSLQKYIETVGISGNIKIWTAGFSRGGAVVNLAAGRLDQDLENEI